MDDVCTFIVFVDFQVSNGIYIYIPLLNSKSALATLVDAGDIQ